VVILDVMTASTKTDEQQNVKGLLTALDDYLASGIHIGMKFKTKFMRDYIYKVREDGLAILDIQKIDERIKIAAKFLSQFEPNDIIVVGRRDNAKKPISMFSRVTGCRAVQGRYYPGTLTNPIIPSYTEAKALLIADPWIDKNAIKDAVISRVPIVGLADTNNSTQNVDLIIPCNNKGKRSLGVAFYLLAREYLKTRGDIKTDDEFKYTIDDFSEE